MIKLSDIPFEHWSRVQELWIPRVAQLSLIKVLSKTHVSFQLFARTDRAEHFNEEVLGRQHGQGILEVDPEETYLGPLTSNWAPRLIAEMAGIKDVAYAIVIRNDPSLIRKILRGHPSPTLPSPSSYILAERKNGQRFALGVSQPHSRMSDLCEFLLVSGRYKDPPLELAK